MKVYLISGRTGAGKTTIAKQISQQIPAFRISHDELLLELYGCTIAKSEFREYCERVNQLIWRQISELSRLNVSVVVEGFGSRSLRDIARSELKRLGVDHEFIYVECPKELRWQRVMTRNSDPEYLGFTIEENDFERMETIREEFDADENGQVIDNSGHNKYVDFTR